MILVVLAILVAVSSTAFYDHVRRIIHEEAWRYGAPYEIAHQVLLPLNLIGHGMIVAVSSLLLAFAIGQLFSILLTSEIMAATIACVASIFVTAWAASW